MKRHFAICTVVALCAASALASAADATNSTSPHYVWSNQKGEASRIVGSSAVPPWKGYAQLTPDEKSVVRAGYGALGAGDEPPYPLAGTQAIIRAIHRDAAPAGRESTVHVVARVSADGTVEHVDVRSAPYPAMGQRLASMLKKSAFKPAMCKGEPCAMEYPLVFTIAP